MIKLHGSAVGIAYLTIEPQPGLAKFEEICEPLLAIEPIFSTLEKMLTREIAIEFLQNSWKIDDVESQLKRDRESFLNKLIVMMFEKVAFHMFFAYMTAEQLPHNIDELDEMCMSGFGGHCGPVSVFTWRLLNMLGYKAQLGFTTVTSTSLNPHTYVIVKDLVKVGDIHLVDTGLGQPAFRAISLNFNKESPVYRDSYLEYKFIKHNGTILRMHGDGDLIKRNNPPKPDLDFIIGKWRRYYPVSLEKVECKSFEDFRLFFDIRALQKNFSPRAARFPGGKAVMILNQNILYIEQDDKSLKKTILTSYEEIFKVYDTYFPTINKDLVQQAYIMWQKLSKL